MDNSAIKNKIFEILVPNKNDIYSDNVYLTNGKSIAEMILKENQNSYGIVTAVSMNVKINITNKAAEVTNSEDNDNAINKIRVCPPGMYYVYL